MGETHPCAFHYARAYSCAYRTLRICAPRRAKKTGFFSDARFTNPLPHRPGTDLNGKSGDSVLHIAATNGGFPSREFPAWKIDPMATNAGPKYILRWTIDTHRGGIHSKFASFFLTFSEPSRQNGDRWIVFRIINTTGYIENEETRANTLRNNDTVDPRGYAETWYYLVTKIDYMNTSRDTSRRYFTGYSV